MTKTQRERYIREVISSTKLLQEHLNLHTQDPSFETIDWSVVQLLSSRIMGRARKLQGK